MDSPEDGVSRRIVAAAICPALNDPLVVSEDSEGGSSVDSKEGAYQELEAHCFCPSNVPLFPSPRCASHQPRSKLAKNREC